MIKLKQNIEDDIIVHEHLFRDNHIYEIQPLELLSWANDPYVIQKIADESLILLFNDVEILNISSAIDYLRGTNSANVQVNSLTAFASKTLPDGNKLFKRYCGIQSEVEVGENTILYTVPFPQVKIIGMDILYAEPLDTISLYILDSTTGTYSTIPNYILNQFGFEVNISKDFFRQESNYDADLFQDMQIKIIYNSQSAKTVGFNFNLSEVKA